MSSPLSLWHRAFADGALLEEWPFVRAAVALACLYQ